MKVILDKIEVDLNDNQFIASDKYTLCDIIGTVFLCRIFMIKGARMFGPNTLDYYKRMYLSICYQNSLTIKYNLCVESHNRKQTYNFE